MATKKPIGIDPIAADPAFAAAALTLRVLTDGLARIEGEANALRIEDYLRRQPKDPRAADLHARLKHRVAAKPAAEQPKSGSDAPPAVIAALALLQVGPAALRRPDTAKQIAGLEDNANVLREGIMAQQQVVDELRSELSGSLAGRLREQHRALVLAAFRAAQSFAASVDDLRRFRSDVITAGYTFRSDILPEPLLRSALILGSETDDSEISRTRRLLEEWKIL